MSNGGSLAFLTGAPGPGELVLIFLVVLLLFGPRRLPGVARVLGKALSEIRRASHEFRDQLMRVDDTRADSGQSDTTPGGEGDHDERPLAG